MRRFPPLARWALIVAAWTLIGLLLIGAAMARRAASGAPPVTAGDVVTTLQSMWLWALFTPPMFWLADRLPLTRARWPLVVLAHLGLAVGFHLVDVVVDHGVAAAAAHVGWLAGDDRFVGRLAGELFINVYSYLAVIGCGYALAYHGLYQDRRAREAELAAALAESQLQALELQLRPHFLFNALNTVSAQIRTGAGPAAVRTLAQLGDLLRALLHDGDHEVTVREEITLVEHYLAIEQTRFGGRLTIAIDVDPDAADALVPRLILQPLAENAIRHGCEQVPGPARVAIDVRVDGDVLRVQVRDSGPGPSHAGDGIGLGNARDRLARLYGAEQRLALEAADGGGALVTLEIPHHTAALQP